MIEQGELRVEVSAWLYAKEEAPASSLPGRYELFDNTPRPRSGRALIRFSSGDEADALITEAGPTSGQFEISEHLREIPAALQRDPWYADYFADP